MEAPVEVKDVEMYGSAAALQEGAAAAAAAAATAAAAAGLAENNNDHRPAATSLLPAPPSSPQKRDRSSSSPESPQSDYPPSQRIRTSSGGGGGGGVKAELECGQCGLSFRKHSDLKKHNARHSRQYRCVEDNCPRSQIGFATVNDLYRHEKSVHGKHIGKSRSYKCFAPGCAKASKLWPRLDNFKQHLIRMHPSEELDMLVKKSEQWHADEEDGESSQGLSHTQDSPSTAISVLQNVRHLHSPPHPPSQSQGALAPLPVAPPTTTENGVGRRWNLTPPAAPTVIGHGPRQTDGSLISVPNNQGTPAPAAVPVPTSATDVHREIRQRPSHEQLPLTQQGQLPQTGPLQLPQQGQLPQHSTLPPTEAQHGQLPLHPLPPAPAPPPSTSLATTTTTTTISAASTSAVTPHDVKASTTNNNNNNHVAAPESTAHREVGPRPEQLARVIHKTEEPGPALQPDDTREISRAAEVRELAPEASCLSCQHYNRRCYMDQSNPWQCVACASPQHCIFRRTVVREGPTSSFSWAELVGVQNPPRKAT